MKTHALVLGLAVSFGVLGAGCSADEEESKPAPTETTRRASSLERTLPEPVPVPSDSAIGGSIDTLVQTRAATLVSHPLVDIGANGAQCTIVRYDDAQGVEQMQRERCSSGVDTLRVGAVVYRDRDRDGKIDEITDTGDAGYQLLDEDHDGKVDRMIESVLRIAPPVALGDFGDVTIAAGGALESRTREDRDHDGRFEVESIVATTSFEIHAIAP
jgi:hypothetical protein